MVANQFDVIVVGGGAMGLSAAYYTARAGKKVLLLEQFEFFHKMGSSGGQSRFFRTMYADVLLALLAEAADTLWRGLEEDAKTPLRAKTGVLFYGVPGGPGTPLGTLEGCIRVMDALGIPYKKYDAAGLTQHYSVLNGVGPSEIGLTQSEAGVIFADRTLHALHALAKKHGAELHDKEPVQSIVTGQSPPQPVYVTTGRDEYRAPAAILAPGAWTNSLLAPFGLELNLKIWQMNIAYYAVDPRSTYPLWFYFGEPKGADRGLYYGCPPLERPGQMKVGTDWTPDQYDSPDRCTRDPNPQLLELTAEFLKTRFRGVTPTPVPGSAETCLFVMTPDQNLVLDRLPSNPNVVIFTGESGQSFKYTPLIGIILSELALAGKTRYNISEFSITRPGILAQS